MLYPWKWHITDSSTFIRRTGDKTKQSTSHGNSKTSTQKLLLVHLHEQRRTLVSNSYEQELIYNDVFYFLKQLSALSILKYSQQNQPLHLNVTKINNMSSQISLIQQSLQK